MAGSIFNLFFLLGILSWNLPSFAGETTASVTYDENRNYLGMGELGRKGRGFQSSRPDHTSNEYGSMAQNLCMP